MTEFLPDKSFFDFSIIQRDDLEMMKSYGEFSQNPDFLVVLPAEDNTPDNRDFLAKILNAAKINPSERAIILFPQKLDHPSLHTLNSQFSFNRVLFFGYPSARIGCTLHLPPYQWTEHRKQQFLRVDALAKIATETNLKRLLWAALQTLNA